MILCLQNGIFAIKGDNDRLINESLHVLKEGGKAFFSTYSINFWDFRLEWFKEQANKGLIGKIDLEKSINNRIVYFDGFVSQSLDFAELMQLGENTPYQFIIEEVDNSSLFLVITKTLR